MKRYFTPYIYILFFVFVFQNTFSQSFLLKTVAIDTLNSSFLNSISFQKNHKTKESVHKEIELISKHLSEIGFIDNKTVETTEKDSIITSYFKLGVNSESMNLKYPPNSISKKTLLQLDLKYDATYIYIPTKKVSILLNEIVNDIEKQGNSFSKVSLKNISKTANGLNAEIFIEKSSKRTIDKIIIKGYEDFPRTYVKHFLKLKEGSLFNSDKINQVSNSLRSISFATEIKFPEILFEQDSTTVYLYLQKTKTNKFDGLIGFNTNDQGKLKFNGYIDLYLNNLLNKGESLSINWKSNSEDRKTFNLHLITPYIFNTPFSVGASLNIHKQDSTFLNTKANFDLSYQINASQQIIGNLQTESSNEISNLNSPIKEFTNLFYGVTYNLQKPDLLRIYENKIYLNINGFWGTRTTTSDKISEQQSKYLLDLSYNWSLNMKHSIFIKNKSALLLSDSFYQNELYRIGGASSIRGFKEESIFSSSYSILNLEYRYHINLTSKIYSISDFGYIQNNLTSQETELFGFGLGYTYQTKIGLIDISYAFGKQSKIPFEFKNSTFHIKYVQLF